MRRLKYLRTWVHRRSGKVYARFRRRGYPEISLPTPVGSQQFWRAYQAALDGGTPSASAWTPTPPIGATRAQPGSLDDLLGDYYSRPVFTELAASTQRQRKSFLERFRAQYGEKQISTMPREFVERLISGLSPNVAVNTIKALRHLMQYARRAGYLKIDPTQGVRVKLPKSAGHATWSEEDIAAFEARWPIGTMQRLALALALYTGQRRSDLRAMGRQHVRGGVMIITQSKVTGGRNKGQTVRIPLHPKLREVIDATPGSNLTFLTTSWGQPVSEGHFSHWFSDAAKAAGLPRGLTVHGLRKAFCRRMAEAGCTPHQIAAISGHMTLKEITHYTSAYDRERAGAEAMRMLVRGNA
jgi:integrase